MSQDVLIEKMNSLLLSAGYSISFTHLKDVRNFLEVKENKNNKIYGEIQELYDELIYGPGMW